MVLRKLAAGLTLAALVSLGLPWDTGSATEDLAGGARDLLDRTSGVEISGTYDHLGTFLRIDLRLDVADSTESASIEEDGIPLDVVTTPTTTEYRGSQYLARSLPPTTGVSSSKLTSRDIAAAVKSSWFTTSQHLGPDLQDLESLRRLGEVFLAGPFTSLHVNMTVGSLLTTQLAGHGISVFITQATPHRLVKLTVDQRSPVFGISSADLALTNYGSVSVIAPPASIDIDDASTLPAFFAASKIDLSSCFPGACTVTVPVQNLGGSAGGAVSTLTVYLSARGSGSVIGSCKADIPTTAAGGSTNVSCSLPSYQYSDSEVFKWQIDNPAYD